MFEALKNHWPEYLIEAWCLATFMISACFFGVLLFHPGSIFAGLNKNVRDMLMGLAMGSTAIAIICSPWGKRSGAHFNPAVTLTFFRLRKIARADALFYIIFQFIGGALGVLLSWMILGGLLADSAVNFVVTVPGSYGIGTAFIAEVMISFFMMSMILFISNSTRFMKLTPFFAGILVAFYIAVENPLSGMSMNPARTFASALIANVWTGWWIYFTAPPIAMFAASEFFVRTRGLKAVLCAKLHHHNQPRCIFNCGFGEILNRRDAEAQRLEGIVSLVKAR